MEKHTKTSFAESNKLYSLFKRNSWKKKKLPELISIYIHVAKAGSMTYKK